MELDILDDVQHLSESLMDSAKPQMIKAFRQFVNEFVLPSFL